ncbi:MAG: type II toxin-antitoxin system VapC family toxin [Burkholderiaceae bacterium]
MIVVDCCVAMSWVAAQSPEDEDYGGRVAQLGMQDERLLIAPTIMPVECCHALLRRSRRERWSRSRLMSATELIRQHGVRLRRELKDMAGHARFALEHNVQGDDALYLSLAIKTGASLATMDKGLRAAAARFNVPIF